MNTHTIYSENSSDHWKYFNTNKHNVLDLGCGKWYTDDVNELSPIYFANNANLVVGIDSNIGDIEYYKNITQNNNKYVFEYLVLNHSTHCLNLIIKYNITAIKCDIEGYENILLDLTKQDLNNITEFALEYHTEELKQQFMSKIPEWGFNIHTHGKFATAPDYMGVLFCNKL
jgi:hypothetical protein